MIKIYKNPEIEDKLIAEVEVIEKVGQGLPFLLQEKSVHKDVTYILEHFKAKVVKSHTDKLKTNNTYTFKKRKIHRIGISHDATMGKNTNRNRENEYSLVDKFLEVDGIQIY